MSHSTPFPSESPSGPVDHDFGPGAAVERPLRHSVLMVCDMFHPGVGGVESHIFQLSQALISQGHHVAVLTQSYEGGRCGVRYMTRGLRVYYTPMVTMGEAWRVPFPTVFGWARLLRTVAIRERATVVHCHQAFSTLGLESILAARALGLRVVFTDHSLLGFGTIGQSIINKLIKFLLADAQRVICVSHVSRENTVLRACVPPAKVFVIPNAIEGARFRPDPSLRPELPRAIVCVSHDGVETVVAEAHGKAAVEGVAWPEGVDRVRAVERVFPDERDAIVVVCMSRLVYRKGADLLVALLPLACQEYPQLRFLIGGDGPKRPLIESTIAAHHLHHRVRMVGSVLPDHVPGYLAQGHLFLNTSLTEAFCMAVAEAACAGLLVVSTSVGGVPEVLPPDMVELAPCRPDALLAAFGRAIARVRSVNPWSQHVRARGFYCWPDVARRTARVYDEAVREEGVDDMLGRLQRYHKCGPWAGKAFVAAALFMELFMRVLEWLRPSMLIEPAAPTWELRAFRGHAE